MDRPFLAERNVENRGEVCYSIWYVYKSKTSISSRFPPSQRQAEKGENGGEEMKLLSLLEHLEYKRLQGSTEQEVTSVVYDSRKVDE